ncbi:MAG: hypothetical protein ABUT20_26440 [Bacteroidota bacterium]
MLKQILSVITGYAIFVITSLALFKISGKDPHQAPANSFLLLTAVYGAVSAFLSGLVLQLIARSKRLTLNIVLAFMIAGFALFSLLQSDGSHWTQILAITIFAPVSILGGLYYQRKL